MYILFFLVFGLIFGSFIAAFTYRYPRGIKISEGRSFCDKCKRKIDWYENIPVVSYLYLGGKCKKCKKKISPRYPIIESITAISFLTLYTFQGPSFGALYSILIFLILESIFIIDFEHQIIPDTLTFAGLGITFFSILIWGNTPYSNLFAGLVSATFLMLIFLVTKGRGMGLGDVKFVIWGGMVLGLQNLFLWMMISFTLGAIVGLVLIANKTAKLKSKIAFGPFLVVGIPLTFLMGPKILNLMRLN